MDVKMPPFEPTARDDIRAAHQTIRSTYRTNRTKDLAFRKKQIRRLYWGLVDCAPLIEDALRKDMGKCRFEANITEIDWCKTECVTVADKLDQWAKDESIVNMPLQYVPMRPRIRHEPLGAILIIGAYNFPFQLNLTPVVGAIAAGNTVVLKPSEHSPHSAMVLKKLFDEYLDPDCYVCVNGAVDEVKCLLDLKFDKVVFTGGKKTGAIIATKAAQSLTPVLLELGGQNPAFVTKHADLKLAARRLLWQNLVSAFVQEVKAQYRIFMPNGAEASPDFSRIVNKSHFDRIKAMLDNTKGKVVMGGSTDETSLFIEPTVVLVDDAEDSMMAEESFGPIWSIMPYDSLDEAIDIANKVDPTPLALYTFGSDEENNKVLSNVTSGGATVNDGFFHAQTNASPLGGVGSSGMGSYHGYYSFRAFSHQRTIARVPGWIEKAFRPRYMPYSMKELERYRLLALPKPNFDRDGNVIRGLKYWLAVVLGLGGKSSPSVALRWGVLIALLTVLGLKRSSLGV
ncbi:aldehyde dehydrogenase family protein [Hirsutella rhossiliensis]|uniref:Aldehyde dehydrogenase n=1 Tax=Hirsutella rhossiliensis TaxID=111463 RepID=A0A9P8ML88_9HYPO|nr:aldehyde dehydrogenase family domain-containing protein [Hirsutella rhossiliensis]KAH0958348.1 aldehyde dehydrogenase family domain-containing protein [Hirsutella rhossiliensis]